MKKYFIFIILIIPNISNSQKKFDFNFDRCRPYRFTIFDQKFIKQAMRYEPYTGNASGYTTPLA